MSKKTPELLTTPFWPEEIRIHLTGDVLFLELSVVRSRSLFGAI